MTEKNCLRRLSVVGGMILLCLTAQVSLAAPLPDSDGKGSMFNKPAPDFNLRGPYGEVFTMARLRGNVIVLQFGTSW